DVEWTAQLLQLQHAHERPELRVTGTLATLAAAESAGLVGAEDHQSLAEARQLATRLRNANVLPSGRTTAARVDRLPAERLALSRTSRLLGYPAGPADDL